MPINFAKGDRDVYRGAGGKELMLSLLYKQIFFDTLAPKVPEISDIVS